MTTTDQARAYLRAQEYPVQARISDFAATVYRSPITVKKQLAAEGARWIDLREAEAKRRTDAMLAQGIKGTAIGYALGYSDRQNFFRAFRRWYGDGFRIVRRTYGDVA